MDKRKEILSFLFEPSCDVATLLDLRLETLDQVPIFVAVSLNVNPQHIIETND
jgi:hypothetical protein